MDKTYKNLEGKKVLILLENNNDIVLEVTRVTSAMIYGKDNTGKERKVYKKVVADYIIYL